MSANLALSARMIKELQEFERVVERGIITVIGGGA